MEEKKRIVWLDELRGLLVIGMVFHHFCYTLGYLFDVEVGRRIFVGFGPLHPLGAGLFILICGFCCHLSHSNVRRGLLLLGAATAMSLLLWIFMPENRIWFGILQLLAVCILLYAAGSRALAHVPLWCGVAVCAVLLVLTWHLPPEEAGHWSPGGGFFGIAGLWEVPLPEAVMQQKLLFPLGLARGYSADYFPLFPWMFVFFAGTFLGRLAPKAPAWACRGHLPFLSTVGRHALWIYLLHQPVIYDLCLAGARLFG